MSTSSTYEERALLHCIADGDEQAFGKVVENYYPQLRSFIARYTHSRTETEEILQNILVRVWINRDKLPEIIHFRAWLYKVASREYLLYLRTEVKASRVDALGEEAVMQMPLADTPYEYVQASQVRLAISEAVEQLTEQRKRIFRMSRDQGMKISEIAAALSISESTVKNSLTTALKQIREYLVVKGFFLPLIIWLLPFSENPFPLF